jgi:glutamate synthase domain-containing protein 1/glutamate synthase domain-containing protein 3
MNDADRLINAREWMKEIKPNGDANHMEQEGGCGVVGFASTVTLPGRHILQPLVQMHNRGNGRGGGIAAVGLEATQMGVSQEILENDYIIQVAYLEVEARPALEEEFIHTCYDVDKVYRVESSEDPLLLSSLLVRPPEVWRYFCRAKRTALDAFIKERKLEALDRGKAEDEFVFQTSFRLNTKYYAGSKMRAFVMSHGRNMVILKVVGYAEDAIRFYKLEEMRANIWIGHQRYPTKGRVWHPGGAHPFIGLDEALVHNGDFANYHSVGEYLAQRNIVPLFLTDTEVSVLMFDLLNRTYNYPLEYIIEALAPTTERDFHLLPEEKRGIYQAIQRAHVHGSPDGPWFFIIARNSFYEKQLQMIGITDTAMLRPQVFALIEGEEQIALVGSEKQAVDSTLQSIAKEHPSVPRKADIYWNARGGSYSDGGAFIFSIKKENGRMRLTPTNKFGTQVKIELAYDRAMDKELAQDLQVGPGDEHLVLGSGDEVFQRYLASVPAMDAKAARELFVAAIRRGRKGGEDLEQMRSFLTLAIDRRYPSGKLRLSRLKDKAEEALNLMLRSAPTMATLRGSKHALINVHDEDDMRAPIGQEVILLLDCKDFPMEGETSAYPIIRKAHAAGWRHVIVFDSCGQRFFGCGMGQDSKGMKIEAYGVAGDYLASGLAGAEIVVHGNAQDQLGQIMASGKLVIYGDVGQTFMYGAKGGECYIMGNAAGRPLINAVGKPRVVINGTCLDYLAESFMAGDPLKGGGFVVLNGMAFDMEGNAAELTAPYPGGNLFSLASGGAIYVRDPRGLVTADQLNGGRFGTMTEKDWKLILPYLQENERLFGVRIDEFLLKVDGASRRPEEVYRKIEAVPLTTLAKMQQQSETTEED